MFSESNCFVTTVLVGVKRVSLISKENMGSTKEADDYAASDTLVSCTKVEIHPNAALISKMQRTCKVKRLKRFHSSSKLLVVLKCSLGST